MIWTKFGGVRELRRFEANNVSQKTINKLKIIRPGSCANNFGSSVSHFPLVYVEGSLACWGHSVLVFKYIFEK